MSNYSKIHEGDEIVIVGCIDILKVIEKPDNGYLITRGTGKTTRGGDSAIVGTEHLFARHHTVRKV